MGSVDALDKEELTVLVTGFGPFRDEYPINPSWEIAASLPKHLPWDKVRNSAHKSAAKLPKVRLLVHPVPVRVSYDIVRDLVPTFWDDADQKIDLALHIGMAGPTIVYSVEHRAHRDGYIRKDVDGNLLEDEKRHETEGKNWIWHGVPNELFPDLDVDDIFQRWSDRCPKDTPLRISEDPGRYLCDFIYFSSQAHLWKQNRPRKVLFLHVPADGSQNRVDAGTDLALQLIASMVESELSQKETTTTTTNELK